MVGELGMLERDVSVSGSEAKSFRLEVQVIHYTKLEERRPHVERVLLETGLDGFPVRWVTEWDQEAVRAGGRYDEGGWGDPTGIAAGSVSLILKHVEAWKRVVARAEPGLWHLILEDDVLVPEPERLVADLEAVTRELPEGGWDLLFVGLGCGLHVPWWRRLVSPGKRVFWRGWTKGWLWGGGGCSRCTEAYLIHPAFAKRLLESRFSKPPFGLPIDWLLNEAGEEMKARSFWVEPPFVRQGAFESWTKDERLRR
jgi:hypothetical protein